MAASLLGGVLDAGSRAIILYGRHAPPIARLALALTLHPGAFVVEENVDGAVQIGAQHADARSVVALENFPVGMAKAVAIAGRHHRPARRNRVDELAAGRGAAAVVR